MRLGGFVSTTEPPPAPLVLESGADVTRLELDRQRTADYLDVEFGKEPTRLGDRKTWSLTVKWVPASKASGLTALATCPPSRFGPA